MTMRSFLREKNEKLYAAFNQSEDIAIRQWLPAVSQRNGSYNSYPHLKNIEQYVDQILFVPQNQMYHGLALSDAEIYVLLCSILLHDIGKTNSDSTDHAYESEQIIANNWASLGIVSERFGSIISLICRFHDCNNQTAMERVTNSFYLDTFGRIRARMIAVLLYLADHLDGTFTRVVPRYIGGSEKWGAVGAFREKIQCTRIDFENKMITTIVDVNHLESSDNYGQDNVEGDLFDYLQSKLKTYAGKKIEKSLLYNIAVNVFENSVALKRIRKELYEMHMPLNEWFIECDNILYKVIAEDLKISPEVYVVNYKDVKKIKTRRCLEPILTIDFLKQVLKGMCVLGSGIFGEGYHNYTEIMNYLCETENNINKIKCAVQRLSTLFCDVEDFEIYSDNVVWSVASKIEPPDTNNRTYDRIEYTLKKLYAVIQERCVDVYVSESDL